MGDGDLLFNHGGSRRIVVFGSNAEGNQIGLGVETEYFVETQNFASLHPTIKTGPRNNANKNTSSLPSIINIFLHLLCETLTNDYKRP